MKDYNFTDITLGLKEEFTRLITSEMMNGFLNVSGDSNPLHIDSDYAQSKGFPSRVVYGMLSSSLYSTLVGVYLPGKHCLLHGLDITFNHPAYVGDSLTVCGEVVYLNEAYRLVEIKAIIKNQDGKKISKANIRVGFL